MAKSEWITIDRLGTKGIEPDMMPVHRDPQSLDEAVNVRALGANLANAGGYRLIPNGDIPDEIDPSNCACPDRYFDYSTTDQSLHIDFSWYWDWALRNTSLSVITVGQGGNEYDQTYHYASGECIEREQAGNFVHVLNTGASRRIQLIEKDINGVVIATHLDYDASAEFSSGVHYVIVEEYSQSNRQAFGIYLDGTELFRGGTDNADPGDWVHISRSNSPNGLSIPHAFWQYSVALLTCLRTDFNGFGRCVRLRQNIALRFDEETTHPDIKIKNDGRLATPLLGPSVRRSAYVDHPVLSGKRYYEIQRGSNSPTSGNCFGTNNFWLAGVKRGLDLGGQHPGQVIGSWSMDYSGNFLVDGVVVSGGLIDALRSAVAIDFSSGDLWIGNDTGSGIDWLGNADPNTDPALINIFGNESYDMVITASFFDQKETAKFLSGPESCRYAAPDGFDYIEGL